MSESDLPARGNMPPDQPDVVVEGPGDEALAETSAGTGSGMEGFGSASATGSAEGGTGAGRGTGDAGPGTTAGAGASGTQAGAEVGAIGSGYGGPVTPEGPTGLPTAEEQERTTTLDGTVGRDATGAVNTQPGSPTDLATPNRAERDQGSQDTGGTATPYGWQSETDDAVTRDSMDSFPASDPPAY